MKTKEKYTDPTLSDIFKEVTKIKDFETLEKFYEVMPAWVDWVATLSIIGVLCGIWVLFMGVICDNDE